MASSVRGSARPPRFRPLRGRGRCARTPRGAPRAVSAGPLHACRPGKTRSRTGRLARPPRGSARPRRSAHRRAVRASDSTRRAPSAIVLAFERLGRGLPERADRADRLFGALCAIFERDAQGFELFPEPADAHPENGAPVGQDIDRGDLLCDVGGVPLRQDDDAGSKAQVLRQRSRKCQADDGIGDRDVFSTRHFPALAVRVRCLVAHRHDYVLDAPDRLHTNVVRGPGQDREQLGYARDPPIGEHHAEFRERSHAATGFRKTTLGVPSISGTSWLPWTGKLAACS